MWTCRRTAFAFIRLCGICSANRRMLSFWSQYFKEKYVRNHTDVDVHSFGQPTNDQRNACSFACAVNAEQATFWHSFAFASVPHALFASAYRCGCASTQRHSLHPCSTFGHPYFSLISSVKFTQNFHLNVPTVFSSKICSYLIKNFLPVSLKFSKNFFNCTQNFSKRYPSFSYVYIFSLKFFKVFQKPFQNFFIFGRNLIVSTSKDQKKCINFFNQTFLWCKSRNAIILVYFR